MTTENVLMTEKAAEPAAPTEASPVIDVPTPPPSASLTETKMPETPKMTRAEFVAELEKLIARGDEAGLESLQIITSLYARQSTKKITSVLDAFLDGLAGPSK